MQTVPTMAEMMAQGKTPDILFWVGCAGSFDERAKRVTQSFARILQRAGINFAVLGTEESCTGDSAKRAGQEFLFQMQATMNIALLHNNKVTKNVTTCPHCFNTLKNEYPALGGNYEVVHHTQLIEQLIQEGKLSIEGGEFKGQRIVFHDPCYLGRANAIYEAPRAVLQQLDADLVEMKRCKSNGLCCGAGGAQMFKESEKGDKEINVERTEEALSTNPTIIATACPFCNTMLTDGLKKQENTTIKVMDVAELMDREEE